MTIIEAQVKDQDLKVTTEPLVASGGINETTVHFSFCENWTGFIKTAVFADAGKENWYNVILENNKAVVPAQVTATKGRFWFGVVGIKDQTRYTTKIIQYDVAEGVTLAEEDVEPPQALIDQILASVGAHTENTANPHNVTKEQIGLGNVDNNITNKVNANSGRISNLEGRVSNLEARISQEDFVEDSEIAYVKDVPTNALPYAEIVKIGGMTYKDGNTLKSAPVTEVESVGANILPYPYVSKAPTINGITFTDNGDGTITANGTATGQAYFVLFQGVFPIGKYFLSGAPKDGLTTTFIYFSNGNYSLYKVDNGSGVAIDVTTEEKISVVINISKDTVVNNAVFKPMLVKGTTALPYRPFTKNILPIPEEVQAIEGYGQSNPDNAEEYNYIDLKNERFAAHGHIEGGVWRAYDSVQYTPIKLDGFIGVEGGGTLTFKNEYEFAVPSEVEYYINAASGVIVDGSPALKVGDTIITEAQLNALLTMIIQEVNDDQ